MEGNFGMSWEIAVIASSVLTATSQVVGGFVQGEAARKTAELKAKTARRDKQMAQITAIEQEIDRLEEFAMWDATIKAQTSYTEPSILALRKKGTSDLEKDLEIIQTKAKTISQRFDDNIALANHEYNVAGSAKWLSGFKGGATLIGGYADYKKISHNRATATKIG